MWDRVYVCRSTILPAMNIRWQINRDLRVYNIYMYAVQLDKKHVYFMERQRSVKCHGTGPFYLLCCFPRVGEAAVVVCAAGTQKRLSIRLKSITAYLLSSLPYILCNRSMTCFSPRRDFVFAGIANCSD